MFVCLVVRCWSVCEVCVCLSGCKVLECLPLEYINVVSRVKCLLLTMSLSTLLAVNHTGELMTDDLVTVLEQSLRLLRLCLTESRSVHLLHSTNLLHCFSALHHHTVATQVSQCQFDCLSVCLCVCLSVPELFPDSAIMNNLHRAQNCQHMQLLQTESLYLVLASEILAYL